MTNCETIRESIGSWLDGELSPGESEFVRMHVAGCVACGEARRQLEKLDLTLKEQLAAEALRIEFMPFWREVQRRINQKRAWHVELLDWCGDFFTAPRIAWSVPAVIALVLAVFSFDSYLPGWGARNNFVSVESIDAHGRSVALLR
ncbi:MAG: zf-HC2 domain-containing protein, partial [Candidatus Binatia bacterium]